MDDMPKLFDVIIEDKDEVKASNFIFQLSRSGFIKRNEIYLKNYINADIGIAFAHIKNNYKQYVCESNWPEGKFRNIILLIAKDRKMLIPSVFLRYGVDYDDGKLEREINAELQRYEELNNESTESSDDGISDEEQELLDYIANHGGRE